MIRTMGPARSSGTCSPTSKTPLAKFIIGGQVRDDQRVVIDAAEDGLTFGVKSGDTVQSLQ